MRLVDYTELYPPKAHIWEAISGLDRALDDVHDAVGGDLMARRRIVAIAISVSDLEAHLRTLKTEAIR